MIWAQLVPMYQNISDYSFEQTDSLQKYRRHLKFNKYNYNLDINCFVYHMDMSSFKSAFISKS